MEKKLTKAYLKKQEKKERNNKWKLVRQTVKDMQNNYCYVCDKEVYGMSAHVHHIIDRRIKALFFDLNNLVLLCPNCHKFDALSVHGTSIYFSEILRKKEPERFQYLINFIMRLKDE